MKRILKLIQKVLVGGGIATLSFSCTDGPAETPSTLSVTPLETIDFPASECKEKVLTVETSAQSWDFTAPDWVEAVKEVSVLKVKATDNLSKSSRVGRIEFSAPGAPSVSVPVFQKGSDAVASAQAQLLIIGEKGEAKSDVKVEVDKADQSLNVKLKIVLKEQAAVSTKIKLAADPSYIDEYIDNTGIMCKSVDASMISIANSGSVDIPAGSKESALVGVDIALQSLQANTSYLATIVVESSDGVNFPVASKRVNILIVKELKKEQKNVCCLEVNNTNPLNLLEYKLEDGTPFFDVAVLFAANIVYDAQNNLVRLQNNANVLALLEQNETYIQPLRRAGIEVQLGLLPHHTPAGLVNLSKKGAESFAYQVAEAVKDYNLDGVFLDEEWSQGEAQSDLIMNPADPQGGLYLCYQLRKQMKELCGRDCSVSVFDVNWPEGSQDKIVCEDGKTYTAGELIDFHVPNYHGMPNIPWTGMTLKDCAGLSIECNLGWGEMTQPIASNIKEKGYGWVLWFGFHPQVGGGLNNNAPRVDGYIKTAAEVFYGQKLVEPTGFYKKIDSGLFDSQRYDRTW